tara:strand:+ start:4118 stop:4435 length:318 start_codon:yes stop_codon:yes gene_type:complete
MKFDYDKVAEQHEAVIYSGEIFTGTHDLDKLMANCRGMISYIQNHLDTLTYETEILAYADFEDLPRLTAADVGNIAGGNDFYSELGKALDSLHAEIASRIEPRTL